MGLFQKKTDTMTEIRTLNVPMKLIERAATNQDFCKALALTLMFRANFSGAQFSDYGVVKLKRILHVGFYNLRQTLRHAVDEKLLYLFEYTKKGKELTALKCTKFPKARAYVRFQMCETRHGMKIFMKSKLQNNCCKYRKDRKRQRLADVADQIRLAKILCLMRHYEQKYDLKLANVMKSKFNVRLSKSTSFRTKRKYAARCKPRTVGTESILNTGYSYCSIMSNFSGLTLYKTGKLVRLGLADRLFRAEKNYMLVDYVRDSCSQDAAGAKGSQKHFAATKIAIGDYLRI